MFRKNKEPKFGEFLRKCWDDYYKGKKEKLKRNIENFKASETYDKLKKDITTEAMNGSCCYVLHIKKHLMSIAFLLKN